VTHVDIWRRPWAFHSLNDSRAKILAADDDEFISEDRGTIWIVTDMPGGPRVDDKAGVAEAIATLRDGRRVYSVPLPLKRAKGLIVSTPIGKTLLRFAHVPDAPTRDHDPSSGEPADGDRLMARVKQVWARLCDVEDAIADPAKLWSRLRERWLSGLANSRLWRPSSSRRAAYAPLSIGSTGRRDASCAAFINRFPYRAFRKSTGTP
jgi:hypothetical protein